MEQFSFSDCKIYWKVGRGGSRAKHKSTVIKELEKLSDLIFEAMNFSKTWSMRKNRDISVKIYLDVITRKAAYDYDVNIAYARDIEAWFMDINFEEDEVGEVVSKKWNIARAVPNKDGGLMFTTE